MLSIYQTGLWGELQKVSHSQGTATAHISAVYSQSSIGMASFAIYLSFPAESVMFQAKGKVLRTLTVSVFITDYQTCDRQRRVRFWGSL